MKTSYWLAGLALLALAGLAFAAAGDDVQDSPWTGAYHLRIVRVTGQAASPGATLGCGEICGTPIIAPDDEAWGTPAQLEALARALGGTKSEAVTGYIVRPSPDGTARFEATIYPGETKVGLRFAARVPDTPETPHTIDLTLLHDPDTGTPLAEARVLSASGRTVAIAAPSPVAGEFIVLAVTPMDPDRAVARIAKVAEVGTVSGDIVPPRLVERVDPVYPAKAAEAARTGKIIVQAVIDTEGVPRAIKMLKLPEGCEDLAAAAVDAISRWRYEPATRDGKPVPVFFTLVIAFRLEEKKP
jgi:TonB family protein